MTISFDISAYDAMLVTDIARLVVEVRNLDQMTLEMDLTACHANGNPMDFTRLLEAHRTSPQDFWHDINGVVANINRGTGKLQNFFVPRFSRTVN